MDKTVECACLKDVHANKNEQSAGILALVASCGLILLYGEIFGSESLTQVHLFLHEAYFVHKLPPPKVFVYDDACHLAMYLLNRLGRFGTSVVAVFLIQMEKVRFVVDRFHWLNHTGLWCKRNVNPGTCDALKKKSNTEAAEITFSWLHHYKAIVKHMNKARYNFIMLWLFHERNVWLAAQQEGQSQCGDVDDDE